MAQSASNRATPLDDTVSVVRLIQEPRLAQVYTYASDHGPTTVSEIVTSLDLSERTVYDDVNTLTDAGFLSGSNERPAEYEATPIDITVDTGESRRRVTPELIAAVAQCERDDDLDTFRQRHGLDGLAVALDHTREYVSGETNHRIVAREMDVSPLEASIVVQALREIVAEE
jgi:predicted DNA-binding transcriptional regulator YafY